MSAPVTLSMTVAQHRRAETFLYPGDGKEAVVVFLCGRRAGERRHRLVVQDMLEIPYDRCTVRTGDQVTWPLDLIESFLDRAEDRGLSIVKVHSHPGGYARFSHTDDIGDQKLL